MAIRVERVDGDWRVLPPERPGADVRRRGRVIRWTGYNGRGWGLLQPDDGGPNLFVHVTALQGPWPRTLVPGQAVTFQTIRQPGRRPRAWLVQVIP